MQGNSKTDGKTKHFAGHVKTSQSQNQLAKISQPQIYLAKISQPQMHLVKI